jgi:hypothetical protein
LESLTLRSCPRVDDESLEVIGGFTNLTVLSIWDISLTDTGLKPLNDLGKLQALSLVNNSQITGAGLAPLTALRKLRLLTITGENVSNDLFAHLHQFPALEDLSVGAGKPTANPKITDEGIKSIVKAPNLWVITLEGTGVTTAGLEPWNRSPRWCKSTFRRLPPE